MSYTDQHHFTVLRDEVRTDERGRLSLGERLKNQQFRVLFDEERGEVLLVPMVSIPARELWVFQNSVVKDSITRGLADAANGRVFEAPAALQAAMNIAAEELDYEEE
jgi:hypothetical protein